MDYGTRSELITFLAQFVSEHKKNRIEEVLSKRTRYLTVVLEDIFKPHNASAVIRTADCLGIQDIHLIENENAYEVNPYVARGATKWVDLHQYNKECNNNTQVCLKTLRGKGYKIYATSPTEGYKPEDIPLDEKIALVFGTEFSGISPTVLKEADGFLNIPMYGFTESYNISVSAAICMYSIMNRLYKSPVKWNLTEEEKNQIKLQWYRTVAPRYSQLEKQFLQNGA